MRRWRFKMAPDHACWSEACLLPSDTGAMPSKIHASASPRLHLGSVTLLALLVLHRLAEAEAFAVHLENLAAMGQAVEQRRGHAIALEDLAPFAERQVARHEQAAAFVAVGEHLEEQFGAGPAKPEVSKLIALC